MGLITYLNIYYLYLSVPNICCLAHHMYCMSQNIYCLYSHNGVGDITKREMILTLILVFKYQVFTNKILPLFVTITAGGGGHDISDQLSLLTSSQFREGR